jgi:hypothetical protein
MRVARDLLLAVLEAASPALGTTRNLVPGLSHFWFDRETVTAFNDVLGIRVVFASDFEGGVEGERLLGLLKNSTAKNVTLTSRTGGRKPVLHVEVGTAGVTLPMRPVTESLFKEQFPDHSGSAISQELIDALKLTMLSCVSKKLASAAERGVTLIQTDTVLDAYTTDDATVSWARVKDSALFPTAHGRALWPREFCDYFIRHFTHGTIVAMTDDAVWAYGGVKYQSDPLMVTVYAKLIEGSTSDFPGFVRRYQGEAATAFKIPDELTRALSRAAVMIPDKTLIELEVTGLDDTSVLRLYCNSAAGEFDDLVEIDANGHTELTVKADVALIRRALAGRTSLALTRDSVVLTGPPGFFHFISVRR